MHDAGTAIAPAFYDHEDDAVQGRERTAADWGADEVFATVPRRRFRGERALSSGQSVMRPRTGVTPRHTDLHAIRPAHPVAAPAPAPAHSLPASPRQAAPSHRITAVAPGPDEHRPVTPEALVAGVEFAVPAVAYTREPEPAGRRTVVVTGRPEGTPPPPRPLPAERHRTSRSVTEHVGGRPDRVAGWAFGMGLLLIVVAAFS